MDPTALSLLMARLERIEQQNDDQLALMREHITKDESVHLTVERHKAYFKIAGSVAAAITSVTGYLLTKLGVK